MHHRNVLSKRLCYYSAIKHWCCHKCKANNKQISPAIFPSHFQVIQTHGHSETVTKISFTHGVVYSMYRIH